MAELDLAEAVARMPDGAVLLIDTAPIVYQLESNAEHGPRFQPIFDAHADGRIRFAVTTVTIAEVLTGPLAVGRPSPGVIAPCWSRGASSRSTPRSPRPLRAFAPASG